MVESWGGPFFFCLLAIDSYKVIGLLFRIMSNVDWRLYTCATTVRIGVRHGDVRPGDSDNVALVHHGGVVTRFLSVTLHGHGQPIHGRHGWGRHDVGELHFALQLLAVERFALDFICARGESTKEFCRGEFVERWLGTLKKDLGQTLPLQAPFDPDPEHAVFVGVFDFEFLPGFAIGSCPREL